MVTAYPDMTSTTCLPVWYPVNHYTLFDTVKPAANSTCHRSQPLDTQEHTRRHTPQRTGVVSQQIHNTRFSVLMAGQERGPGARACLCVWVRQQGRLRTRYKLVLWARLRPLYFIYLSLSLYIYIYVYIYIQKPSINKNARRCILLLRC